MDYFYQTLDLSDNQDGCQNGRHLSVYTCGHSNLVIYHLISSKFHIWTTFIKLLFMSEYGFCQMNDNHDFFAKTDIPFSLLGIRRGPLSESDCSSGHMIFLSEEFGSGTPRVNEIPVVPNRIAQLVLSLTANPGVPSSIPAGSYTLAGIDHEIIFTAILLPSADSRRVVVSYKRKFVHEALVNHLVKIAHEKSVVR